MPKFNEDVIKTLGSRQTFVWAAMGHCFNFLERDYEVEKIRGVQERCGTDTYKPCRIRIDQHLRLIRVS